MNHVTLAQSLRRHEHQISLSSAKALLSLLKKIGLGAFIRRVKVLASSAELLLSYIQNRGRISFRQLKERFERSSEALTQDLITLWGRGEIEIEGIEGIDRETVGDFESAGKIPLHLVDEDSRFVETTCFVLLLPICFEMYH